MKGIKTTYDTKGKLKQIIITPNATNPILVDMVDTLIYESRKHEETLPLSEVMAKLDKKHKLKR